MALKPLMLWFIYKENPSCFIAASWVMVEWCVGPVADACASMLCVPVWI